MDAQARVVRHESELGSWELVLRSPDPRLRALVGEYEGYVETAGSTGSVVRQQVPTTWLPLIVNFGSAWEVSPTRRPARVLRTTASSPGSTSARRTWRHPGRRAASR